MEVKEALSQVKALLEKGWIQGAEAKKADGTETRYFDPDACKFCMLGALSKVAVDTGVDYFKLRRELVRNRPLLGETGIPAWNDDPERTKEEVIDLFERAINGN